MHLNLPPIAAFTRSFTDKILPAIGWRPTDDYRTLIGLLNRLDFDSDHSKKLIPRVPGWDLGFPITILRPYSNQGTELSLNDIGHTIAQELIGTGRHIHLKWSGGIDSTFALTFLLENLQNPDQLTVLYTPESLAENADYMEHIKRYGVETSRWDHDWQKLFNSDALLVSGDPGDTISGSVSESFINKHGDRLRHPWQDFVQDPFLVEQLEGKQTGSTTLYDLYWWAQMCISHQFWTTHNMMWNLENIGVENSIGFFDHILFDGWAHSNREYARICDIRSYKIPYKQEIHRYWSNDHYFGNKIKKGGHRGFYWVRRKMAKFDQQFLFMYCTADKKIRTYRPDYFPILDMDIIARDIKSL